MTVTAVKAELKDILALRGLFLQETNFQIRYNACHERGWSDSYLLKIDGIDVGYGSIKGQEIKDRDTIFEFYVIRPLRNYASSLFRELISASGARYIECQSNDHLLSAMLYEFSRDIRSDVVLFGPHSVTEYTIPDSMVRPIRADDQVFEHEVEPFGDYVLEVKGEIVATGGFLLHYNPPFADLYMEVRKDCRRQGYGTFILQELQKKCYLAGRVPAARCQIKNVGSRAALTKSGLRIFGFMQIGNVKEPS
ncbi:MAG TPA: GNAT family N-acetyltransferase [Candidatus Angelobacter sp.]|nr:GNAT family N-acetyltransferase [Candidatus Angelobacter sp.]